MFGFGIFSLFGARRVIIGGASLGGAGALGTIVVAFVTVQKLNTKEKVYLYILMHTFLKSISGSVKPYILFDMAICSACVIWFNWSSTKAE